MLLGVDKNCIPFYIGWMRNPLSVVKFIELFVAF